MQVAQVPVVQLEQVAVGAVLVLREVAGPPMRSSYGQRFEIQIVQVTVLEL